MKGPETMIVLFAAAICLGACLPLFMIYKKRMHTLLAAVFKTLGTSCAFIISLIAALKLNPACILCAAGMLLHAAGDFVLEFRFLPGAGLFFAGHILYIGFILKVFPFSGTAVLCFLCLMAMTAFMLYRWRKVAGKQTVVFSVYGAMLCALCACCLGCGMASHTFAGILAASAGSFFFLSDGLLCYRLLFPPSRYLPWAVMITYYTAQLLFSACCYYI